MQHKGKSIRPFIGAKNFEESRCFYKDLGFTENVLSKNMSVFHSGNLSFYLQDAYVKDWIDNTMVFMEVEDVNQFWKDLVAYDCKSKMNISVSYSRIEYFLTKIIFYSSNQEENELFLYPSVASYCHRFIGSRTP